VAEAKAVGRPKQAGGQPVACPRCEAFNPRGAVTCASCGLSLVRQAWADRYTQAPWQLALLSILTFSLYDFYWFHRTWRMLRDLRPGGQPRRPGLRMLGLLVPGLNCVLIYRLFRDVHDITPATHPPEQEREGLEPAALLVLYVGFVLCWRLPTPWWWIASRLAIVAPLLTQRQVNRAVVATLPDVRGARQFSWPELVALAVGIFFTLLVLNSTYNCALCIPTLNNT